MWWRRPSLFLPRNGISSFTPPQQGGRPADLVKNLSIREDIAVTLCRVGVRFQSRVKAHLKLAPLPPEPKGLSDLLRAARGGSIKRRSPFSVLAPVPIHLSLRPLARIGPELQGWRLLETRSAGRAQRGPLFVVLNDAPDSRASGGVRRYEARGAPQPAESVPGLFLVRLLSG